MRILETVFSLVLSVIAFCLLCVLASPDVMCADDDTIYLPGENPNEKKATSGTGASSSKNAASKTATLNMLPGYYYDLRQIEKAKANAKTNTNSRAGLLKGLQNKPVNRTDDGTETEQREPTEVESFISILNQFVNGNWKPRIENGYPVYSLTPNLFQPYPMKEYSGYFYQTMPSASAVEKFQNGNATESGWFSIHSGYVRAPFSGWFRFVGCGDDALVVRFNGEIVLDYGYASLGLGKIVSGPEDCVVSESGAPGRPLFSSKVYSVKPEVYFPGTFNDHGIAKGVPIHVTEGYPYSIEILCSDFEPSHFAVALFVEQLKDAKGTPKNPVSNSLPLFRTAEELPENTVGSGLPGFDADGPRWQVVDSKNKLIRIPVAAKKDTPESAQKKTDEGTSKKDSGAASSAQSKTAAASAEQKSDPQPEKTSAAKTGGKVTTKTVTEYNSETDTTIETVTTTEENGDTTVETTVVTETKNGKVVKKTSSTTTTTRERRTSKTDGEQAASGGKSTSDEKTKSSGIAPFGQVQRPVEDDE